MSSLGGDCRPGKRFFSWSPVASVSSTDNVVCESQTTFSGSRTSTLATSSAPSTSWMCDGASTEVPSTSSWPRRPLTGSALDLLVTAVTDQQDVVVVLREPPGLLVHLADQRAGGVDRAERS